MAWEKTTTTVAKFDITNVHTTFHTDSGDLAGGDLQFRFCATLPVQGRAPVPYDFPVDECLSGEEMSVLYSYLMRISQHAANKLGFVETVG